MMKMDPKDIECRLRSGMDQAAPDEGRELWEKICAQSEEFDQGRGNYWYLKGTGSMPETEQKNTAGNTGRTTGRDDAGRFRTVYVYRAFAAAAAVFVLFFVLSMQRHVKKETAPWATVCLDVNPGVTLEVDENERVTQVDAENTEGEMILDNMDLKQVQIDVAVNALVGSMVRHGYLNEAKQFILLTVDGKDKESAMFLQEKLSRRIDRSLEKLTGRSAVFGQLASSDEEVKRIADTYGITTGKAFLLKKLVLVNPQLGYEELAGLTMEELYNRLMDEGIDLSDYADYTGDDLEEEEENFNYEDEESIL